MLTRKARKGRRYDRSIVLPRFYVVTGADGTDYGAHSYGEARHLVTFMARNGESASIKATR